MNNTEKILNGFGERLVKLSKINLGATKVVDGKRRKIDNTGTLRKSVDFNVEVSQSGSSFSFDFVMEDYGEFVDQGRKPGKGIPQKELFSWIKSKPIRLRDLETGSFIQATESRIKSLAFLINRKIKEEGIAATHFFSEPFEQEFEKLPDEIIEAFGLDVEDFLQFALNK